MYVALKILAFDKLDPDPRKHVVPYTTNVKVEIQT